MGKYLKFIDLNIKVNKGIAKMQLINDILDIKQLNLTDEQRKIFNQMFEVVNKKVTELTEQMEQLKEKSEQ